MKMRKRSTSTGNHEDEHLVYFQPASRTIQFLIQNAASLQVLANINFDSTTFSQLDTSLEILSLLLNRTIDSIFGCENTLI